MYTYRCVHKYKCSGICMFVQHVEWRKRRKMLLERSSHLFGWECAKINLQGQLSGSRSLVWQTLSPCGFSRHLQSVLFTWGFWVQQWNLVFRSSLKSYWNILKIINLQTCDQLWDRDTRFVPNFISSMDEHLMQIKGARGKFFSNRGNVPPWGTCGKLQ